MPETIAVPLVAIAPALEMPQVAQQWMLWVTGLSALIALFYTLVIVRQQRSWLPLVFLTGGSLFVLFESVSAHLGHAYHPPVGQIALYQSLGLSIPLHMLFVYVLGAGLPLVLLYQRMASGHLSSGFIWKTYACLFVALYICEILPIHFGVWGYFDRHSLWVWKGSLPLPWIFSNATVSIAMMTILTISWDYLKGLRQLLAVPLILVSAGGVWVGVALPFLIAINSAAPQWVLDGAGLLTIIMSLSIVQVAIVLCGNARRDKAAVTL